MTPKQKIQETIDWLLRHQGTTTENAIRDMLTELMHACDQNFIFFNDVLHSAQEVYEEES